MRAVYHYGVGPEDTFESDYGASFGTGLRTGFT